jgi:hypothetical protein
MSGRSVTQRPGDMFFTESHHNHNAKLASYNRPDLDPWRQATRGGDEVLLEIPENASCCKLGQLWYLRPELRILLAKASATDFDVDYRIMTSECPHFHHHVRHFFVRTRLASFLSF